MQANLHTVRNTLFACSQLLGFVFDVTNIITSFHNETIENMDLLLAIALNVSLRNKYDQSMENGSIRWRKGL